MVDLTKFTNGWAYPAGTSSSGCTHLIVNNEVNIYRSWYCKPGCNHVDSKSIKINTKINDIYPTPANKLGSVALMTHNTGASLIIIPWESQPQILPIQGLLSQKISVLHWVWSSAATEHLDLRQNNKKIEEHIPSNTQWDKILLKPTPKQAQELISGLRSTEAIQSSALAGWSGSCEETDEYGFAALIGTVSGLILWITIWLTYDSNINFSISNFSSAELLSVPGTKAIGVRGFLIEDQLSTIHVFNSGEIFQGVFTIAVRKESISIESGTIQDLAIFSKLNLNSNNVVTSIGPIGIYEKFFSTLNRPNFVLKKEKSNHEDSFNTDTNIYFGTKLSQSKNDNDKKLENESTGLKSTLAILSHGFQALSVNSHSLNINNKLEKRDRINKYNINRKKAKYQVSIPTLFKRQLYGKINIPKLINPKENSNELTNNSKSLTIQLAATVITASGVIIISLDKRKRHKLLCGFPDFSNSNSFLTIAYSNSQTKHLITSELNDTVGKALTLIKQKTYAELPIVYDISDADDSDNTYHKEDKEKYINNKHDILDSDKNTYQINKKNDNEKPHQNSRNKLLHKNSRSSLYNMKNTSLQNGTQDIDSRRNSSVSQRDTFNDVNVLGTSHNESSTIYSTDKKTKRLSSSSHSMTSKNSIRLSKTNSSNIKCNNLDKLLYERLNQNTSIFQYSRQCKLKNDYDLIESVVRCTSLGGIPLDWCMLTFKGMILSLTVYSNKVYLTCLKSGLVIRIFDIDKAYGARLVDNSTAIIFSETYSYLVSIESYYSYNVEITQRRGLWLSSCYITMNNHGLPKNLTKLLNYVTMQPEILWEFIKHISASWKWTKKQLESAIQLCFGLFPEYISLFVQPVNFNDIKRARLFHTNSTAKVLYLYPCIANLYEIISNIESKIPSTQNFNDIVQIAKDQLNLVKNTKHVSECKKKMIAKHLGTAASARSALNIYLVRLLQSAIYLNREKYSLIPALLIVNGLNDDLESKQYNIPTDILTSISEAFSQRGSTNLAILCDIMWSNNQKHENLFFQNSVERFLKAQGNIISFIFLSIVQPAVAMKNKPSLSDLETCISINTLDYFTSSDLFIEQGLILKSISLYIVYELVYKQTKTNDSHYASGYEELFTYNMASDEKYTKQSLSKNIKNYLENLTDIDAESLISTASLQKILEGFAINEIKFRYDILCSDLLVTEIYRLVPQIQEQLSLINSASILNRFNDVLHSIRMTDCDKDNCLQLLQPKQTTTIDDQSPYKYFTNNLVYTYDISSILSNSKLKQYFIEQNKANIDTNSPIAINIVNSLNNSINLLENDNLLELKINDIGELNTNIQYLLRLPWLDKEQKQYSHISTYLDKNNHQYQLIYRLDESDNVIEKNILKPLEHGYYLHNMTCDNENSKTNSTNPETSLESSVENMEKIYSSQLWILPEAGVEAEEIYSIYINSRTKSDIEKGKEHALTKDFIISQKNILINKPAVFAMLCIISGFPLIAIRVLIRSNAIEAATVLAYIIKGDTLQFIQESLILLSNKFISQKNKLGVMRLSLSWYLLQLSNSIKHFNYHIDPTTYLASILPIICLKTVQKTACFSQKETQVSKSILKSLQILTLQHFYILQINEEITKALSASNSKRLQNTLGKNTSNYINKEAYNYLRADLTTALDIIYLDNIEESWREISQNDNSMTLSEFKLALSDAKKACQTRNWILFPYEFFATVAKINIDLNIPFKSPSLSITLSSISRGYSPQYSSRHTSEIESIVHNVLRLCIVCAKPDDLTRLQCGHRIHKSCISYEISVGIIYISFYFYTDL